MRQNGVQFLATQEDILNILDWLRSDRETVLAAGHYSTYFYLKLRRTFRKGAWLFSPYADEGTYLKSQHYTGGAKSAYDRGLKLMALVGWNYDRLEEPGKDGSVP